MVRNATKLYYPVKQSIQSILPLVDEFVVAIGNCDEDDHTLEEIRSIRSEKIKIIRTTWDLEKYPDGMEHAHQTDIAREACTGDWLFYLQSDEIVHQKYLPVIKKRCRELLHDRTVEGLLFEYRHFWGDYNHYIVSHAWYPREIRIIRNDKDIHSWESAQSFRRIPNFNGITYRQHEGTYKLKVAKADAYIHHYGWVRPPDYMQKKRKAFHVIHKGEEEAGKMFAQEKQQFDYGRLKSLRLYREEHPQVIRPLLEKFNWASQLYYDRVPTGRVKHKHEKLKYRLLTFLEQRLFGGRTILGFRNFILLNR